ncbi:Ankyrin repeat domain-containing protein 54 [Anthophora quadrimaculata]
MTSMDSGIETSNNSDDSSIAQNEDRSTNEINVNSAAATITSTENDKNVREIENSTPTKNSRSIVQSIDTSKIVFAPQLSTGHRKMQSVRAARKDRLLSMFGIHSCSNDRRMRIAAATNNTIMMKRLLSCGVTPNNCDIQGRTPLHIASSRGYTEIVRLLLEYGADASYQDCLGTDSSCLNRDGYTPLQLVQMKLKFLQNCSEDEDIIKMKEEVQTIVKLCCHMVGYVEKHKDSHKKMETLCNFYSRLSLSNTTMQVQDDVKELLANLGALSITR